MFATPTQAVQGSGGLRLELVRFGLPPGRFVSNIVFNPFSSVYKMRPVMQIHVPGNHFLRFLSAHEERISLDFPQ